MSRRETGTDQTGKALDSRRATAAVAAEPPAYVANEIQRVCLQLRLTHPDTHCLVVTAPRGREGASTVASLCAAALAEIAGGTVLLVDANLHAPTLHRHYGLNGAKGLRNWDPERPAEGIHPAAHDRLSVMPAGTGTDKSLHAMYRSGRLAALATRLRADFAFVVWDTPPINVFPDARFLLPHADGVLVVAEADITPLADLATLCEQVGPSGCPLVGVILNRTGRFIGGARAQRHTRAAARNGLFAPPDDASWE
jgi:Mrp family chromosome partitioning ATPase